MNITTSLGTHFSDGLRSGPIYSTQLTTQPNVNGTLVTNDYNLYGPGILHSSQFTYNIVPSPPNLAGGYTTLNNVVGPTTMTGNNTYLPLRGDNSVTYYVPGSKSGNGSPLLQLDWPRVITVTVSGAPATAGTRVTIFGFDYYLKPLQHTYVIQATGTYPAVTYPDETTIGTLSIPAKAFYQVNNVFIDTALPTGCTVSLGASDIFGLPYRILNPGVITSIGWGIQDGIPAPTNANPIQRVTELDVVAVATISATPVVRIGPAGVFVPADISTVGATTGDVRGLYATSRPSVAQYNTSIPVDYANLAFTYYVAGADTWINQVNNAQQNYMQANNVTTTQGVKISPLDPTKLYGLPQFYTGQPS